MKGSQRMVLLAALSAAGNIAAQVAAGAKTVMRAGAQMLPAPSHPERTSTGLPGMGHGSKVRGNRAVKRVALKARNVARHRANCRGSHV